MQFDIIIVGGGFAGMYAAWRLAKDGVKVALVEAAEQLGGTLLSKEWNGYWLDNGTHNFDLRSPIGNDFYSDVLRDNITFSTEQTWACTTDRTWTSGFEMPDFSEDNKKVSVAALHELQKIQGALQEDTNLHEDYLSWYKSHYGATLANAIAPMMKKYTGSDPTELAFAARASMGMFSRPKIGTDTEMITLKESSSFYDDRLGVSLLSGDDRFSGRSVVMKFAYPAKKGLRGFCECVQERLIELGVSVFLSSAVDKIEDDGNKVTVSTGNTSLSADRLFWSLPDHLLLKILNLESSVASLAVPVGSAFFAFEVDAASILGPDYLHDYSTDRLPFRYNKAGVYGQQIKENGKTYVMAEVPCHPKDNARLLSDTSRDLVWQAMKDVGFVEPETEFYEYTYWGYPVAFTLPKVGWEAPMREDHAKVKEYSSRITGIEFGQRGRHTFMTFYENVLQHKLKV